ncbi:MAG: SurA N-terminal domain-containing protein [Candidatus Nanopelagicales bacterium]|nr:SurA N-terminal domain-containing protein [Candidatus Nanopelagicales bacterium]
MTTARRALIPAAVLALGLALTACTGSAGDAAVVGESQVTEASLNSNVSEVLVAQGFATDKSDPQLVKNTLNWLVVMNLLDQVAADNNVAVTQGEIDREHAAEVKSAGSEEALEAAYLKQSVAPSQISERIRFALTAQKVAKAVAPNATPEQATAALVAAVVAKSKAVNPEVNPRFGTWDSQNLQLGADSSDLSTVLPAQ